jgi:hypothetical protein
MDECYENGTSRRFTNLAHSRQLATLELTRREAGKSESAKCGQRPESAPHAEIQEFSQACDLKFIYL